MFSRRFAYPLFALVLAVALWLRLERSDAPRDEPRSRTAIAGRGSQPGLPSDLAISAATPPAAADDPADFPLAAPLNAPGAPIGDDLETLSRILDAWRTNFPRDGNPVGENREITAALLGQNALQLRLIPKNHPALNAQGELCDRWGTPFRFHQLSGERMEIQSAGPDRKFGTADDAQWSPGS